MPTPVEVLKGIAAAAQLVQDFRKGEQLKAQLEQIRSQLDQLREDIAFAARNILMAIKGVSEQIDEDVALDNVSLADRALHSDLEEGDRSAAMGNSFEAARRLTQEDNVNFASAFMHVVTIRLTVLKVVGKLAEQKHIDEVRAYIPKLRNWIAQLNSSVEGMHTLDGPRLVGQPGPAPPANIRFWQGTHFRRSVGVRTFRGPINDMSEVARREVQQQLNASRAAGIAVDREQFGIVAMEATAQAWEATRARSRRRSR